MYLLIRYVDNQIQTETETETGTETKPETETTMPTEARDTLESSGSQNT